MQKWKGKIWLLFENESVYLILGIMFVKKLHKFESTNLLVRSKQFHRFYVFLRGENPTQMLWFEAPTKEEKLTAIWEEHFWTT